MSVFSCTDITKRYRHFCLDNISFSMESGYFYILTGVNGSGKTTLLDCISGISDNFSGDAQIDGTALKSSSVLYRQKLGYISEKRPFFMEESIASNGLTYGEFYSDWSVRDFSAYLQKMDLDPSSRVYELSKGDFMKLQVCFSLAHHPAFLILDEPLEGFDPVFRRIFLSLLGELLDRNMGILLSTHITEDVDLLADYLLILENGRLVRCTEKETLSDEYIRRTGKPALHIRDLLDMEHTGNNITVSRR